MDFGSCTRLPYKKIMSGAGPKFNIFPTRMALTTMKNRLKGAQTGHSLLKRKSEALTRRFRDIVAKIDQVGFLLM
jgi:V-type H+-transporting ATPase subunit D